MVEEPAEYRPSAGAEPHDKYGLQPEQVKRADGFVRIRREARTPFEYGREYAAGEIILRMRERIEELLEDRRQLIASNQMLQVCLSDAGIITIDQFMDRVRQLEEELLVARGDNSVKAPEGES